MDAIKGAQISDILAYEVKDKIREKIKNTAAKVDVKIFELNEKTEKLSKSDRLVRFSFDLGAIQNLGIYLFLMHSLNQVVSRYGREKILSRYSKVIYLLAFLLGGFITFNWMEGKFGLDAISDNRLIAFLVLAIIAAIIDLIGIFLFFCGL